MYTKKLDQGQLCPKINKTRIKRICNIMRITFFLLCVSILSMSASVYSQDAKISIHMENQSIDELFSAIKAQTDYSFWFNLKDVDLERPVTMNINNASVKSVLAQALKPQNVEFALYDNHIIITRKGSFNSMVGQQGISITGTVIDETGEPIPGVNVVIKGTVYGTVTDSNGNYSISIPNKDVVLVFSFIGYISQEMAVGEKTTIEVTLKEDTKEIEEVVVIGYGTQKKTSLTGSVSAISVKSIKDRPVVSVSNLLNGLAPGLSVVTSTGVPGQSSAIRIRGIGTYNSSTPLYVIDGIIRDQAAMDALDPNSISDISILKDAASAAVYGSRAGNGVILVNTIQGYVQAPQITFRANYSMESRTVKTEMMDAYENGLFINDMLFNMNEFDMEKAKADPRYVTPNELEYLKGHDYNWLEYAWRNPNTANYNLSVNGGSQDIKYYLGLGYVNNNGVFDDVNSKKISFQGNTTVNIAKNLTATVNLSAYVRNVNLVTWRFADGGDLGDTYRCLNEWGGSWMPPYIDGIPTYGGYANLIEAMKGNYNKNKDNALNGLLSLNYKIPWVEGLKIKGTYSYNFKQTANKQFSKPTTSYQFKGSGEHGYIYDSNSEIVNTVIFSPVNTSRVTEGSANNIYQQFNLQLDYARSFGKHSVNASLIFEQSSLENKNLSGYKNNLLTTAIDELFVGGRESSQTSFGGSTSSAARLSYIGRIGYIYDNKYLLDASFREDGSYIFPPNKRWGFFPSVSAGWIISEESFFRDNISFVDHLKIRASLGLLGNDAVNPYQWQASYTAQNGPFFDVATSAITYGVLPNKDITWEKTRITNIGFDTRILSNTLDFSFDYFYRLTSDMLYSRIATMPGTFGANLPNENYGKVENNGFEISLGYNGNINNSFNYYIRGNVGYAKDRVKYIDVAANVPPHLNPIGKRLNKIQGYVYDDVIRTDADLTTKIPLQGYAPVLGIITYKDLYGPSGTDPDGIVNGNDQVFISENVNPLYNYGISLGASWKNFSIDVLFQGLGGWDKIYGPSIGIINGNNYAFWNDRWSLDNPDGKFPRAWYVDGSSNQTSTFWLRNASFLRLKNLNIAYTIPSGSSFAQKLGLKGCRVFINGNNLLLIYNKMKYMDPELGNFGSYPLMRDITGGIEISF